MFATNLPYVLYVVYRSWKEYRQPCQQEIYNQINGEIGRKCVSFPEEGESCYKNE
jgi:hypothetical protein